MNSDFLLITGDEWIEVPEATTFIGTYTDINQIQQMIAGQEWGSISPWLEQEGLINENGTISDMRFLNTNDAVNPYRLWFVK